VWGLLVVGGVCGGFNCWEVLGNVEWCFEVFGSAIKSRIHIELLRIFVKERVKKWNSHRIAANVLLGVS
jgi:hypothetical protein